MNERIRELSDIAYKNHLARNPHSSYGRRSDYDREFAELIVRECQDRVEQYIRDCGEIGSLPDTVIKNHFGVDGMSTEDKKTLIKELLGVKND